MAYEIPKNLTRYSEIFLWGMSFKTFLYFGAYGLLLSLVIFKLAAPTWLKVIILLPLTALLGLLVFGRLEERYIDKRNLDKSLHNISYFDRRIDSFMDIKEIKDKVVLLKNNTVVAILKLNPIDFSILSDPQKEAVLNSYNQWLRSLDYPIQIVSRSVNIELEKWLENLEQKDNIQLHKDHFDIFKGWLNEQMSTLSVRNRIFYVLIPLRTKLVTTQPLTMQLKNLVKGKKAKADEQADDLPYQKALKELAHRLEHCQAMLKFCGLKSVQLNTAELLELYASYFTNVSEMDENLMTPVMWLKKVAEASQNRAFEKVVKSEK